MFRCTTHKFRASGLLAAIILATSVLVTGCGSEGDNKGAQQRKSAQTQTQAQDKLQQAEQQAEQAAQSSATEMKAAAKEVEQTAEQTVGQGATMGDKAESKAQDEQAQAASHKRLITIGTGGVTGVYYATGNAICRLVNKNYEDHGVRCSVESTGGSIYNINTIRAGELDMGVAQSDWQYHAYNGSGKEAFVKAGPFQGLRAVFSVHPEPVSIVARKDANITTVEDLVGKRVNIGNPGSGTEATWNVLWKALGHNNDELKLAAKLKSSESASALCDNKIDAYVWTAGNPNALTKEAATTCDVVMVDISGGAIDKLVGDNPYYSTAVIPGGMYNGNPNDTSTFGARATFVSADTISEHVIYTVVKAVFDNLDTFKSLHPAFANLDEKEMIAKALSVPLHKGAVKYYKERGWM